MPAADPDPILRPLAPITGRKRPIEAFSNVKRIRSKLPRRKRIPLLPIVGGAALIPLLNAENEAESSSSCLHSELADSDLRFAGSYVPKAPTRARRQVRPINPIASLQAEMPGDEFRRITRSYARQQERLRLAETEAKVRHRADILPDPRSGVKSSIDGGVSLETAFSKVSRVSDGFPDGNLRQKAAPTMKAPEISESSCLASESTAIAMRIPDSAADVCSRVQISDSTAVRGVEKYDLDLTSDLACSERISTADGGDDEESSEYTTCNELTVSEYETELLYVSSSDDFSCSSLSDLVDSSSGDDFSEKSRSGSAPSVTFSLFIQLGQQIVRLSSRAPSGTKGDSSEDFILLRFEDEEDEESYQGLRMREMREVVLHDYDEYYSSANWCGDLLQQQRLLMVNWIVEYANAVGLQTETLFLGVSLMDRFLSRGCFQDERNLQLLGIACVTLATRIEENQPYNSIRTKSFTVERNVYGRSEVVAMEWLVMEVLEFQCFLPTTHNFLWWYLKAAKADAEMENLTHYLAVLSLLDHERLRFWPSTVAAGLVILACLATNHDSSCQVVMETHVRTKKDDLPECIQSLEWLVKYAC